MPELVLARAGTPVMQLPVDAAALAAGPSLTTVALAAGSAWLHSADLDPKAPSSSYAGVRITGGLLDLDAAATLTGTTLDLDATTTATLSLAVEAPADPPAAAAGIGADAAAARATPPQTLTVTAAPAATTITATGASAAGWALGVELAPTAAAPDFRAPGGRDVVALPCVATAIPGASRATAASTIATLAGSPPVVGGAWGLRTSNDVPGALGEAEPGIALVELGAGLTLGVPAFGAAIELDAATLELRAGDARLQATPSPATQTVGRELWQRPAADAAPARRSTLEVARARSVTLTSATGGDGVSIGGDLRLAVDAPCDADGAALALAGPGDVSLGATATGTQLQAGLDSGSPRAVSLALDNGLLAIEAAFGTELAATLDAAATTVQSGEITTLIRILGVLPTLADPYLNDRTARRVPRLDEPVDAILRTTWTAPAPPAATIELRARDLGRREQFVLADVSTHSDLLGVDSQIEGAPLTLAGMTLQARASDLYISGPPLVSQEPIHPDDGRPDITRDSDGRRFRVIHDPDDGGVRLCPVNPAARADRLFDAAPDPPGVQAQITLPIALDATLVHEGGGGGRVFGLDGEFPQRLRIARQLRMIAPPAVAPSPGGFKGSMAVPQPPGDAYANDILGTVVTFVEPNFKNVAPLESADIAAHGLTSWSLWHADNVSTGITSVTFHVLRGRTVHDVIVARSTIFPWGIPVVRVITLDRQAHGGVDLTDTGWRAMRPGEFVFPQNAIQPPVVAGAIKRLDDVRNIREIPGATVNVPASAAAGIAIPDNAKDPPTPPAGSAPAEFQRVRFDADLLLSPELHVLAGVDASGHVAAGEITGWLQLRPTVTYDADKPPIETAVSAEQVVTLLAAQGPAGGTIACNVDLSGLGGKGPQLRATGFDVSGVARNRLVAALRGAPKLPGAGAWGVAQSNDAGVRQLPAGSPVPVVQLAAGAPWQLADPLTLLGVAKPETPVYGYLQSTGTQKVLALAPKVAPGAPATDLGVAPHMADIATLLGAGGVFPNLGAVLQSPNTPQLGTTGDGAFAYHDHWVVAAGKRTPLLALGVASVDLVYERDGAPAEVTVDADPAADPAWNVLLANVTLELVVSKLGTEPLMKIGGNVHASAKDRPSLRDPKVGFGGMLGPVQSVFSRLDDLARLAGVDTGGLHVAFADGHLTVTEAVALPKLPLGMGDITDVAVELGMTAVLSPPGLDFSVGIGSERHPFHWIVTPLSGTGALTLGVASGDPVLTLEAGIGAGIAIDVGVASGSASLVLALAIEVRGSDITLKVLLTGQATVDVLAGLASAALTLTAGLGVQAPIALPPEHVTIIGLVAVGIHVAACWGLAGFDWDGSWQFSQTYDIPQLV